MNKNIYIIYPAGYSGNYINWAITKSDSLSSHSTVDNPINNVNSADYGGEGTSHLHHRLPTHAGIKQLMYWLILHQPTKKQVFIINAPNPSSFFDEFTPKTDNLKNLMVETAAEEIVSMIMNFDKDPIIIHITAEDEDYRSVGTLNGFTKWPIFYKLQFADKMNIDISSLKDNIKLRNFLIKNYELVIPKSNQIIFDKDSYEMNVGQLANPGKGFVQARLRWKYWFKTRNKFHSHEVNDTQYISPYFQPKHFFSIDISEIYQLDFISKLEQIVNQCDLGEFNFTQAAAIHPNYINAQVNLRYLDEIKEFRITKKLTTFLKSNSVVEALVIREVMKGKSIDSTFIASQSIEEILDILRD